MAAVRSRENKLTELRMVAVLRCAKLRGWRRHLPIPGTPDFAFPARKLAIFIDGCFWHGCPRHFRMPSTNRRYWCRKIAANKLRDRRTTCYLRRAGWTVLRIWEHEFSNASRVASRCRFLLRAHSTHDNGPVSRLQGSATRASIRP
ncbi:MAG: DNA mismatch endonuclease Vsr [Verrucomicrobiae bacterium]|nr:DNA mismatch endonuclease Vsr [Verrucomicrobiae bacterium]